MKDQELQKNNNLSNSRRKFLEKVGLSSVIVGTGGTVLANESSNAEKFKNLRKSVWDPYDYGAKADGSTIDTKAIQAAIDACNSNGGGKVILYGGTFVSGTFILKSNVCLHVEPGTTLLASKDINDYPDITPSLLYLYTYRFTRYLIYAEKAENISITGSGTIDGRGRDFERIKGEDKNRPYILRFSECKNVMVRDITFLDSARWLQHYLACEDVNIDGIKVIALTHVNSDGLDVDSCNKVRISNSYIESRDDAIVLKATAMQPCKNVTVSNCVLRSKANALKLGTESNGGFENIVFTACAVYDTREAISLEMVDGAKFDRVTVSNIVIHNAKSAIFIRLGNRARPIPGLEIPGKGSMSNIIVDNIQGTEISNLGCSITGLPEQIIENVRLSNIHLQFKGGGTRENAKKEIPEKPEAYPASFMYGILPAYGFFCRHLRNLNFHNISISYENEDARPALYCENIQGLNIDSFNADISPEANAVFVFNNVKDSLIRGCRPTGNSKSFLEITDSGSENISLFSNDLSKVQGDIVSSNLPGDKITTGENVIKK